MALYLITGTPGAGKTLNTLRMVHKRAEDEDRTVFYYGIDLIRDNPAKIDFSRWIEMQGIEHAGEPGAITPHSWQQAPDGAIILIDECHFYYPPVGIGAKLPDFIMDFAIHRHRGFDIYLITQGPARVNSAIKDWVSPHIHFRKIWGRVVRSYENEVCVNDIRNVRAVSEAAIKRRVPEDKRWFGAYVSASVHTKNKRTPVKLLFMALFPLFVVLPLSIWYLLYYFQSLTGEAQARQVEQHQSADAAMPGQAPGQAPATTPAEHFARERGQDDQEKFDPTTAYIPRIEAMPETAPAYDDLRRPQDFPRPSCLMRAKRCECYTQQATLMRDYPQDVCRAIVRDGQFDPTRADGRRASGNRGALKSAAPPPS